MRAEARLRGVKMSASRNTVVAGVGVDVRSTTTLFSVSKLLIARMEHVLRCALLRELRHATRW